MWFFFLLALPAQCIEGDRGRKREGDMPVLVSVTLPLCPCWCAGCHLGVPGLLSELSVTEFSGRWHWRSGRCFIYTCRHIFPLPPPLSLSLSLSLLLTQGLWTTFPTDRSKYSTSPSVSLSLSPSLSLGLQTMFGIDLSAYSIRLALFLSLLLTTLHDVVSFRRITVLCHCYTVSSPLWLLNTVSYTCSASPSYGGKKTPQTIS